MLIILNFFFIYFTILNVQACSHSAFAHKIKLLQYDDSLDKIHPARNLQTQSNNIGKQLIINTSIRFYFDYSSINLTTNWGKHIYSVMEVAKIFWQHTIQLKRLSVLNFPTSNLTNITMCYDQIVPSSITNTVFPNYDYGMLINSESQKNSGAVAYSYPCAYLKSNNRPFWAIITWNIDYIQYDPISFQGDVYVGLHQMTHCLGFSPALYSYYIGGSPVIKVNGRDYINSSAIQRQLFRQYGCSTAPGMLLQSEGSIGTAGTHWARKTANNQYITASMITVNPPVSYLTLSLLQTTGWYTKIFYQYGQFIRFGYQKGCGMLDPNNCSLPEYCQTLTQKGCDYDLTAGSHCTTDDYTVKCGYFQYYDNFVCVDPRYLSMSVNINGSTGQSQGYNSRCFKSTLRGQGLAPTKYSIRCYQAQCSKDGFSIIIKVGNLSVQCNQPGETITVKGFDGDLTCPTTFDGICKMTYCHNWCHSNGVCVKGRCVCSSSFSGGQCDMIKATGIMNVSPTLYTNKNLMCELGSSKNIFGDCQPCHDSGCAKCDKNKFVCDLCFNNNIPGQKGC